ncbi:energy-coupling factor ABC transporter permease [Paenibacillus alkalitolerans]|uniref:energy-coupling factor ABC transporter permease n=1 Tax=Paenibacillus alkalitolerans TaxID=2799335 RepID=UPI0018F612F7|nr:energy-coupling factor ABC transporter permease [Paenibacillus alkalitolerans]
MHLPDGFLDVKVWAATSFAGAAALGYCLRRSKIDRSDVPSIGMVGAFIFAAQMVNFPVAGATSGHFLGGALASILFGPLIGVVIMAAVLTVQALLFQDGGITVLGANILCTGVIGSFTGYWTHKIAVRWLPNRWDGAATFAAGWLSIVMAAAGVALLLAWSETVPLQTALSAMLGWHGLIGIGEGLATMLVCSYFAERKMTPVRAEVRK